MFVIFVDYLQPGDVTDASSSSDLLNPGRLGRLMPSPGRSRPLSNVIQPAADSQQHLATLPGHGNGEKESVDGNDNDGKTVASDDDDDAGYSSGPDDDEE